MDPSPLRRLTAALLGLTFVAVSPQALAETATPANFLLGDQVRPDFERIHLVIDPAQKDYSGRAHVDLTVLEATKTFRLHAEDMDVTFLALSDESGRQVAVTFAPISAGRLEVTAQNVLTPGVYSLDVDFQNDFGTRAVGLYRAEHQGNAYSLTQFEAIDAREALPIWDEPAVKIPYQLVLTVPSDDMAVTNTPEVARFQAGGMTRITFQRTRPLPSYLLALAVGPFESMPIEGMSVPGRVLAPKGLGGQMAMAAKVTPPIVAALEDYFGRPYPYPKLDLIAVPELWLGAMENPGLVTFADKILLIEPAAASAGVERRLVRATAHELAHMWFGDLVTMRWWDDLWLNESFADWLGNRIAGHLHPELGIDLQMLRGVQQILSIDARPSTEAIRQPIVDADASMRNLGLAYAKGRAVLGMVEQWIGPDVFRQAIRTYIDRHADGNTVAADLWQALAEVSGKDVQAVLADFVDQPGYPLLSVTPQGDGTVVISQRRFLNAGVEAADESWQLPVRLKVSRGGEVTRHDLLLTGASQTVDLGSGVDWVMPNADALGYYRWQVPSDMLQAIAAAAPDALDPAERIAFLGNTAALLDTGTVTGATYLRVLSSFADDPDPDVVAALIGNLSKVEHAFVPAEMRGRFAVYVRRTLGPVLERFGMEPLQGEPDAVTLVRPHLLGWLGDEGGDPRVLAFARGLAEAYLQDPSSVAPSLSGVSLRLTAKYGDAKLFETYRKHFEESTSPAQRVRFLNALSAFDDPAVRARALDYTLDEHVLPTELFTILNRVEGTPGGRDRVFAWLVGHYDAFASRLPPERVALLPTTASGCSAERLERGRQFFSQPEHHVEGTGAQLAKVTQQVMDCVHLREREGAAVAGYLRSLGSSARASLPRSP